jgi:hypothetical protein
MGGRAVACRAAFAGPRDVADAAAARMRAARRSGYDDPKDSPTPELSVNTLTPELSVILCYACLIGARRGPIRRGLEVTATADLRRCYMSTMSHDGLGRGYSSGAPAKRRPQR